MSEWNRTGREDGQRRYGAQDDHRQAQGARGPGQGMDRDEARSFGRGEEGGYGGYGGYGAYGQDRGGRGRDLSNARYGGEGGYRGEPYGGSDQRYGGGWRGQGYGGQGDGDRSGLGGGNSAVQRVSDGEHRGRGPKNYIRSDERIREDVNDRLSDDSWLDASEIEVGVSSGEVTLTGTVNEREDKRRAEDVAERVSGVKHVQNNLRVQPSGASIQRPDQTHGAAAR